MRKLCERETRRKRTRREKQDQPTEFDDMVASDEEDSDDGRTLLTAATRMSRMTKQSLKRRRDDKSQGRSMYSSMTQSSVRIKDDVNGEVQDMTDLTQTAWNVNDLPSDESDSEDDGVQIDDSGMIVVSDNPNKNSKETLTQDLVGLRRHNSSDTKSISSNNRSTKGKRNSKQQLGAAYKAKKAGGDAKKKGQKYDPYAYVPLDGRSYTKKNRRNAVEQMSSVVQKGRKRQRR